MADDILKNIWSELSSKGKTDSEFDAWKTNMYDNEEVQNNVYGYLKGNGYTNSEFGDWKTNVLLNLETNIGRSLEKLLLLKQFLVLRRDRQESLFLLRKQLHYR
jgi:hypothetical protein